MTVGPFWRYYGGKWRAAPRYPRPEQETIVEPFAGAAGYSCRYPSRRVILIDASPIICGIWRYLIAASPSEILALPDIPEGGTVDDMGVCQEARWLAGFWCNNGAAAPCKSPSAWAREHEDRGKQGPWAGWGWKARKRIAADVQHICHWQVIQGAYTSAPDIEATWMVDPPYQTAAGRHYKEQVTDYAALGEWVQTRQGQIIACDQQGADWLPWNRKITLKATDGAKRDGKSREVYWHRSTHPSLFPEQAVRSAADEAQTAGRCED
jgi:hypothetical protein